MEENKGQILLYQTVDGESRIEVTLCNDTVWLTLDQMAELVGNYRKIQLLHFLQQLLLMVKYIKWLIIIWI